MDKRNNKGLIKMSCPIHRPTKSDIERHLKRDYILLALAGNANVGKSVIFNQLTGSNQVVGNWPGKTVELAFGRLRYKGIEIHVVDLPGIYSLSTYTQEEEVTKKYIAQEKPDIIINVVDASVLERNLYFTLQLLEMGIPTILCLNQIDIAKKNGIEIDVEKLQGLLGIPVVPTVAIKGEGLKELVDTVLRYRGGVALRPIKYKGEIEEAIENLSRKIIRRGINLGYSPRFIAIKMLEGDEDIIHLVRSKDANLAQEAERISKEISMKYGEPTYAIIASQRYLIISKVIRECVKEVPRKRTLTDYIDMLTVHKIFGFITSAGIITLLLLWTFYVGDLLSTLLEDIVSILIPVEPSITGSLPEIIINGILGGIVAGITLVIPYVIPFYLFLAIMEDSGIMTRIAFMLDSLMHKIGLHGKAIIPIILGYGCSVPGVFATRILEEKRERILASLAITLVPCSARTIVILGLAAAFLGIEWALLIYIIDIVIVFIIDYITSRIYPGVTPGLIMEIHQFRIPSLKVVLRQTLNRTLSIIYMVFPIYIIGSATVQVLYKLGALGYINTLLSPLTTIILGLPDYTGTLLIFGFIRKELILLLLPQITGTFSILTVLTPVQIFILAIVSTLYIPCLSTTATLLKEFGWRDSLLIIKANITTAILIGSIIYYFSIVIF